MAALRLRTCRPPPSSLHIPRPIHVHPLGRRGPSSASLRMQALTRRHPFRANCDKRADNPPEPENQDPDDKSATSENFHLVDEMLNYVRAAQAEMGIRETPDMFVAEKERISSYMLKLSSPPGVADAQEDVRALTVCRRAQSALDLASHVMDIAIIRRGTVQFSQHTVDQMVRTYAAIFCNVAEDAYHMKFNMETALSFLAALRGLGAIFHILVQDTVAKLKDGRFKNSIVYHMGKHSQDFDKAVKYWEDAIVKMKPLQIVYMLLDGLLSAKVYIASLANCREAALSHLKD
ncbi:hypothetical protein BS78_03G016200 [Paspalum vaginatum]|nr:hypothetical protein BS78_03G016200 [Paspalum vaginatum]